MIDLLTRTQNFGIEYYVILHVTDYAGNRHQIVVDFDFSNTETTMHGWWWMSHLTTKTLCPSHLSDILEIEAHGRVELSLIYNIFREIVHHRSQADLLAVFMLAVAISIESPVSWCVVKYTRKPQGEPASPAAGAIFDLAIRRHVRRYLYSRVAFDICCGLLAYFGVLWHEEPLSGKIGVAVVAGIGVLAIATELASDVLQRRNIDRVGRKIWKKLNIEEAYLSEARAEYERDNIRRQAQRWGWVAWIRSFVRLVT